MTDTEWADVSEFQTVVNNDYPYRWLSFRSNDGTYRDRHFAANMAWAKSAVASGRLDAFIVYFVYEPDGGNCTRTLMSMVVTPHPRMVVMIDVESWGGRIKGDHSADINAQRDTLAKWLGGAERVIGYGNVGDLNNIWPHKNGARLVVAAYGSNPSYPGKIAHQYADNAKVAPFGTADINSADGYTSAALMAALGLGTPASASPAPASVSPAKPFVGRVTVNRPVKDIQRLVGATQDGIYGPVTTADVQKWQRTHGLTPDGIWGPKSDAKGFPKPVLHVVVPAFPLKPGYYFGPRLPLWNLHSVSGYFSHNTDLREWQTQARKKGYYTGRVDGKYGPLTAAAALEVQKKHHLKTDKLIGPVTWHATWA